MRDLTSIQNMLPDLQNKLAFMYYKHVKQSKHYINVDRSEYNKAEASLTAIESLIICNTDLVQINAYLNDFIKHLNNCCLPAICDPDVVELECQADATTPTFWIPDDIACQVTTSTTTSTTTTTTTAPPTLYEIYATVTSFDDPDLVAEVHSNVASQEIILKAETGSDKQYFLIDDTLPKSVVDVFIYSYALGNYINVDTLTQYTYSTITGFKKYVYNGAKRGSTKIKLIFA